MANDSSSAGVSSKSRWSEAEPPLRGLAVIIVVACGSWWLLGQLAIVLRPLLVAVFLAFVLLPYYMRMRKAMPVPLALTLAAGIVAVVLGAAAIVTYASILGVQDELPSMKIKAVNHAQRFGGFVERNLPWLIEKPDNLPAEGAAPPVPVKRPEVQVAEKLADLVRDQAAVYAGVAANAILEAAVAGLYLFFLLLEAGRFPDRVREAYDGPRARLILDVFGRITAAIIGYLKAKVQSSLLLAVAVAVVLTVFGVRFVILWAILTFLFNFIPYIGSVLGFGLPTLFAGLYLDPGWAPVTCVILLLTVHILGATVTEPMLIGKAVGLSPLVILAALTMWGSIWGLPGMFLAVPLTMVVLIVLDNIETTRPIARLLHA